MGDRISPRAQQNIKDKFGVYQEAYGEGPKQPPRYRTPEDDALTVLDLERPVTLHQVKARYKVLVKKYHPDANGGDKTAEEKFKQITEAYQTLKDLLA